MNKLRVLLVAAALLSAACGATTISGSQVKSISSSGNVRVDAGANAGTSVSSNVESSDLGPRNPTPHKPGPAAVQQSQQPAPAGSQPTVVAPDRCNGGGWIDHDGGNRSSTGSLNHPLLPACAMQ
jgi:hypothetical protein